MNKNDDKKTAKTLSDKNTRRTFLKNMGFASLGTAIALGNGDKVLARLLRSATSSHVDGFLSMASSAEIDPETLSYLETAGRYLLQLSESDSNVKNTIETLKAAFLYESGIDVPHGQTITSLGLPLKKSDAAAVSFLWSMKMLRTGLPTKLEIAQAMSDPRNVLNVIEPDYIRTMADRVSTEWRGDRELSAKLDQATGSLTDYTSRFLDDIFGGGGTGGGGDSYSMGCTYQGAPMTDAACIVLIIIVIVPIIIGIIQGIKKKCK